jgi:sterol 3beta-glucosyltransferase
MRILLLALGTRGDVQPFVALGKRLQRAGHDVAVCASAGFAPWIREHGLGYAHMHNDILDLVNSDAGRKAMEGAGGVAGLPKRMIESARQFKPIFRRALAEQGAEVIIYNRNVGGGYHIAEALGIVGIMADAIPTWVPTSAFPHVVAPDLKLGGWYNRLTHGLVGVTPRLLFGGVVSRWRKETLKLPPRPLFASEIVRSNGQPVPTLLSFSPHVVAPPPDWPQSVRVTGYWFLDEGQGWQPPPRLVEFLAAGTPPVFVGFGSMAGRAGRRVCALRLVVAARRGGSPPRRGGHDRRRFARWQADGDLPVRRRPAFLGPGGGGGGSRPAAYPSAQAHGRQAGPRDPGGRDRHADAAA